jgi:lysozyme family protein
VNATFEAAIGTVLKHEGGFVNNPADPGGATNYGVSLRYLKNLGHELSDINHDGVVDERDIRQMSLTNACTIYKQEWWDRFKYGSFSWQDIATKVFDTAVNVGSTHAHQFLQKAINQVGHSALTVDGVLGEKTFSAVNSFQPVLCIQNYRAIQLQFYKDLTVRNPNLIQFLHGWENRAKS